MSEDDLFEIFRDTNLMHSQQIPFEQLNDLVCQIKEYLSWDEGYLYLLKMQTEIEEMINARIAAVIEETLTGPTVPVLDYADQSNCVSLPDRKINLTARPN